MREIKFRARDFENPHVWHVGNLVHDDGGDTYIHYEKAIYDPVSLGFVDTEWVEAVVDYETVGQYTGLKDKNGVEIYEGDIVALSEEFDEDRFYAVEWYRNGYWLAEWDGNEYGFPDEASLEVIGNIYENSELLEQSE